MIAWLVRLTALSRLLCFLFYGLQTQKTQDLLDVLEAHPWADDRSLLVYAGDVDDNFALAARNVRQLNLIPACGLNVYDILKHDNLVFSQQALDSIYERLLD